VPDPQGPAASVAEPLRNSNGKVEVEDGRVVIVYQDDRAERWTPVGKRMVVEHWYPGARFPSGTPVLGIADGAKCPIWPNEGLQTGPAERFIELQLPRERTHLEWLFHNCQSADTMRQSNTSTLLRGDSLWPPHRERGTETNR
jgi:hypothetical protein